jgi:2'-5' RNA ligase
MPVDAGEWFAPLVADVPPNLRVFHPDDLHMTVAFLGGCGEEAARSAFVLAEGHPAPPFTVTLGGLAAMGNPRRPSALSLLLEEGRDQAVAIIAALRDDMCKLAGARPDDRPPKPHITVARPPRRANGSERRAAVAWAESVAPLGAKVTVDRLCLYTWSEDRKVRQFREVASTPLAG